MDLSTQYVIEELFLKSLLRNSGSVGSFGALFGICNVRGVFKWVRIQKFGEVFDFGQKTNV